MGTKQSNAANKQNNNLNQNEVGLDDPDAQKLNPKVKKWLMEADKYTSYSVSKDAPPNPQAENSVSEGTAYRDPEMLALQNLKLLVPLFPVGKARPFFTTAQDEEFQKKMYVPDVWPILFLLQDLQSHMNQAGNMINDKQALISDKIEDHSILCIKVIHNLAVLGSEVQAFESHLQSIFNLEASVRTMQERLRTVVKKTFNLLDLIPEDERIDMPSPVFVSVPYLRKDQYSSTNLYENTTYFLSATLEEREMIRANEDRWLQDILPNWNQIINAPDIKRTPIWRAQIPFRLRGYVWKKLIHNKLGITPELYMELQSRAHQETPVYDEKSGEQNVGELIRRDLPRTFPELKLFKNPESEAYNQILKVLETAAFYQPEIGYVQGMSYVCAILLLFMNHYDAFVCFTNLLNTPFMRSVCKVDPSSLAKHSQLFQIIFAQYAPNLYQHFNNLNITTEHFLLDWWLTLFSKTFSIPISTHIWDSFLLEGEIFIHFAAVGALKLFETQLLEASFEKCLDLITTQIPKNLVDSKALFAIIKDFEITPKIQAIMEEMDKEILNL